MLALAACSGTATSPGRTGAVSPGTSVAPVADTTVAPVADTTINTVDVAPFPSSEIAVGDVELRVWVADDPTERSQGLRRVEELPAEIDGMLFVWETATPAVFVMEDTLIPLDVWFFDEEGMLVGTHEMTPCPDEPCARYPSPGSVRWVLETPLEAQQFGESARLTTSPSG